MRIPLRASGARRFEVCARETLRPTLRKIFRPTPQVYGLGFRSLGFRVLGFKVASQEPAPQIQQPTP